VSVVLKYRLDLGNALVWILDMQVQKEAQIHRPFLVSNRDRSHLALLKVRTYFHLKENK